MNPVPTSIKLSAPGGVAITWSDGHQATYRYSYLRRCCPCATCRDKPPEVKSEDDPLRILGQEPIRATGASQVGHYAIQFQWNDRHSSGIYSFAYLREICPCEECRPTRSRC
ncbi:MAG: gamma-butyrobetaine hydroxylase-like domain-containing protein [Acidobacteriota bacterium]